MLYLFVYSLEDHTKGSLAKCLVLLISIHRRTQGYISARLKSHAPFQRLLLLLRSVLKL